MITQIYTLLCRILKNNILYEIFCAYSILSTSWETKPKSRTIIKKTFEFSYWSRQDTWSLISWEFDDDDNDDDDTVYQGSTRVFRDGPESKYFRICWPKGRGKIKDVYKVRTQHPHRFIYYRSICIVENKFNQILGELLGNMNFFWDKITLHWGSELVIPNHLF